MVYFIECKSCNREVVIERETPGSGVVSIIGKFTTFPRCPHCGAKHIYEPEDIRQREEI
jgi:predicted RNA-binding Zn-ribbon protein involved in translation (DUF1610 family)